MGAVVVAMAVLLIPGIGRIMRRVAFRTAVVRFLQRYISPRRPIPILPQPVLQLLLAAFGISREFVRSGPPCRHLALGEGRQLVQ